MANRNPLVNNGGYIAELTPADTLNVPGQILLNGLLYKPGFEIFIPGALALGADVLEYILPSGFNARALSKVSARVQTPSTNGSVSFRLELYTGTGAFAASQTSDTFSIAQGAYEVAPAFAFMAGLTGSGENKVRLFVTNAGTGAANLIVKAEF